MDDDFEKWRVEAEAWADYDTQRMMRMAWNSGVLAEREACAKLCDEQAMNGHTFDMTDAAENCADAIRARSNVELTCRQQPAQEGK